MASGIKIGNAKKVDGLYYFIDNVVLERQAQVVNKVFSQTIENKIMLWHYRLRHPTFYYLQKLFPLLLKDKSPLLMITLIYVWCIY